MSFLGFNYIKKADKGISMKFYQTIPWLAPFYWPIWTFVAIINVIVYILLTLFSQTTGPMYTKLGKNVIQTVLHIFYSFHFVQIFKKPTRKLCFLIGSTFKNLFRSYIFDEIVAWQKCSLYDCIKSLCFYMSVGNPRWSLWHEQDLTYRPKRK